MIMPLPRLLLIIIPTTEPIAINAAAMAAIAGENDACWLVIVGVGLPFVVAEGVAVRACCHIGDGEAVGAGVGVFSDDCRAIGVGVGEGVGVGVGVGVGPDALTVMALLLPE
jgi:hypothetical protein